MSNLIESLETLLEEHDRIGSPLRDRLVQGKSPGQVEAAIRALGLTPPSELVDLFAWHDLRDSPGDKARIPWFWPAASLRLDEAVASYRQSMQIGGVTPDELARHVATTGPGSTFTGLWRSDWLPILYAGPEAYAVECAIGGGSPEGSAVWRTNWHPDEQFQTVRIAPTLTAFVDRVVELFRAGAYEWSAEEQTLMTVDDVFDHLGLGATVRPWP